MYLSSLDTFSMAKDKKKSFVKWLEILQQESWQLELLISGFAIFLLASAYDSMDGIKYQIDLLGNGNSYFSTLLTFPFQILLGSWYVLIINLVLHVLLRGLWISTIGIRYVSGEIDFDFLNLSSKFDRFLKKRIISFDHYIQQLEQLCSIVFGFTFLIIFLLISGGLFVIGILLLVLPLTTLREISTGLIAIPLGFLIVYIFGGFLYFIDFMTLGWIKKRKSIASLYYPIYRFFSVITLSFVYRPLYYNLIDNKYGRKVVLFLIPYGIVFILISSMTVRTYSYLPDYRLNESLEIDKYDDTWREAQLISSASVQSKFVKNGYIELYLPYVGKSDDEVISLLCPDLKAAEKGVFFFGRNGNGGQIDAKEALDCHSQRFQIFVNDSLLNDLEFRFFDHPKRKNNGLLTILDVDFLERGEHKLKINVLFAQSLKGKDTLVFRQTDDIPFWIE